MSGREVANLGPLTMPPRSTPEQHRRIAVLYAAVESDGTELVIAAAAAPTNDERRGLERRQAVLTQAHRSVDPKATMVAVTKLLGAMLTNAPTNADVTLKVKEYSAAVSTMPTWAVEEACEVWKRGGYGISHRPPTSAELAQRSAGEARPFLEEAEKIRQILRARVVYPERRMSDETVDAMVAQAKGRIIDGAGLAEKRAAEKAEFDRWMEANDERLRQRDEEHRAARAEQGHDRMIR